MEESKQNHMQEKYHLISELVNSDKLNEAKKLLLELHTSDLADYIDKSSEELRSKIINVIFKEFPAETLVWLDSSIRQSIAETLGVEKLGQLITDLDVEDAIEVLEDFNDSTKTSVLVALPEAKRLEITEGFNYPEDSAGRIMEKDFLALSNQWSAAEALNYIKSKDDQNDFQAAIIVDRRERPVGIITLIELVRLDPEHTLELFVNSANKNKTHTMQVAEVTTDESELAYLFKHYGLTIIPVVNKVGKLVGAITVNNMVYIIDKQAEEDALYLGGLTQTDTYSRLWSTARKRYPWLMVNLITAFITSSIIGFFGHTIEHIVTLAFIVPIVASMGGNAGTQTLTVAIRAIANRDITNDNFKSFIAKETLCCIINGLILGLFGGLFIFIVYQNVNISFIFASAVVINFLSAGLLGSTIPIILNRYKVDPAIASSVFLTALTDSIGFFFFLGLAHIILLGR